VRGVEANEKGLIDMSDESKLVDHMKVLFADNFSVYTKAHGYHVAVVGHKFYEYHKLYQKIYEFLQDNIDTLAEGIRSIDETPPFSLKRIMELTEIQDAEEAPNYVRMSKDLYADLETTRDRAGKAYDRAGDAKRYGTQNLLAQYIQEAERFMWMLDASTQVVFTHEEDLVDAEGEIQPTEDFKPVKF
jgi:starvation-inducible DNA-binding protein